MKSASECLRRFLLAALAVSVASTPAGALPPRFFFQPPTNVGSPVSSSFDESSPEISADGLTLLFTSTRPGGFGDRDIWISTRPTTNSPWDEPTNLGSAVNGAFNDSGAALSPDGLTLLFQSTRPGGPGGAFDVWMSTRAAVGQPWTAAANVGAPINSSVADSGPAFARNHNAILFDSKRAGGFGEDDIYLATRTSDQSPWTVTNLGAVVNSTGADAAPTLSADGLGLYFVSARAGSVGGLDIWQATRSAPDAAWESAESLGPVVNTVGDDLTPSISADGRTLYFRAVRGSGQDIWTSSALPAIHYTRFNEPRTGDRDFAPSGDELGFATTLIAELGGGSRQLGVVDEAGRRYRMRSVEARAVFGPVDLTNYVNVEVSFDVLNSATSWEAGDFYLVELTNGSDTITVTQRTGADALDGVEGVWQHHRATVPDGWTTAQLVFTSLSNSSVGDEYFDLDNVAYLGTYVVPEPNAIGLAAIGVLAAIGLRSSCRAWGFGALSRPKRQRC